MLTDIDIPEELYITEDIDAYEDHADGLMDALFGEVEHILSVENTAKGVLVSTKLRKPATANPSTNNTNGITGDTKTPQLLPSDTVSIAKLDLPALTVPPLSSEDVLWLEQLNRQAISEAEYFSPPQKPLQAEPQHRPNRFLLERGLTIAACTSVIFVAGLWTFRYGLASSSTQKPVAVAPPTQPEPDTAQFAEEVRQSFIAISNKEKEKSVAANPTQPGLNLSNLPLLPPLTNNGQQIGNGVQPIYVPVYQPPTPAAPVGLPPTTTPTAIAPAPGPAPAIASPAPAIALPAPSPVAIAPSNTLIGILDVGEQSSAMFDINGSVQSVRVGSQVAGSGWVLSRITQQEAILKRGNETRSVFVGQKF
ncbi:hypothetical protein [Pseudanabaena sp. PCC 6802]|uniref:hypothetical protein n=1 Tax=Pseudanabaena sp. PCC 6802 TaxID=118173 RepID=UPI000345B1BC|nr:hypothetical protein [Pseudanabaena sp. PCC 6802]